MKIEEFRSIIGQELNRFEYIWAKVVHLGAGGWDMTEDQWREAFMNYMAFRALPDPNNE